MIGADNAVVSYAAWKAPCGGSLVAATCTIAVPHAKVLLSCRGFLGMVSLALLHALFCLFCSCSCIMHMQPAAVLLLVAVVVCQHTVVFVHASVLRTAVGRVCVAVDFLDVCAVRCGCVVCVWKASYAAADAACSRTYAEFAWHRASTACILELLAGSSFADSTWDSCRAPSMLLWPPIWPTVLCSWVGAGAGYGVLWGQSARPQVHFPATAGGAGSVWTAQHSTSDFVLVLLLSEYARLAFGRVALCGCGVLQ